MTLRYPLHASVIFLWEDGTGRRQESRGHTRDLGQKGAFIVAPTCPPNGAHVSLSIFLPAKVGDKRVLRIEAQGCVLRAEHAGRNAAGAGFAVSHQRVDLYTH